MAVLWWPSFQWWHVSALDVLLWQPRTNVLTLLSCAVALDVLLWHPVWLCCAVVTSNKIFYFGYPVVSLDSALRL